MASGFILIEQSVKGLGNAFAGGCAVAEDATTVYFNPAGLTRFEGHQASLAAHVVMPSAKFKNEGSTHILQAFPPNSPLLGGDGGDGGVTGYVPNFYYSYTMESGLAFGIGVNAPFGLATEYPSDWVGRYHAIKSELMSVNINPSIAYKLPYEWDVDLSIGFGVSAMYVDATLSNAIDFGTLDALGAFPPLSPGELGLTPQLSDGYVELEGNGWAYGFNIGVLLEITEGSRIGLAYRSGFKHEVEGTAAFDTPPELAPVQGATGYFTDCDVTANVDLPDYASFSAYQEINDQWAVMGDVTWTHWATFEELRFKFSNGQPDGYTTEDWQDTWRFSGGATFRPTEQWTARAGIAYDPTAIPDELHRTPRIPGEDRFWLSIGGGYKLSERFEIDAAYAHLFVADPKIDKSEFTLEEDQLRGGLKGTYDASVDIISAQLTFYF
jgi:long-chain fatty acid transport protein